MCVYAYLEFRNLVLAQPELAQFDQLLQILYDLEKLVSLRHVPFFIQFIYPNLVGAKLEIFEIDKRIEIFNMGDAVADKVQIDEVDEFFDMLDMLDLVER